MSKTVGILGGMGPLATVDLFAKIVENTPAERDQDHLRIIIDNNPQIPPRVEAIMQDGESPLPAMAASARLLAAAGADFIVMPCNTAHFWLTELEAFVDIPFYGMVDNAAAYIAANHRSLAGRVLLLATAATVRLGLYQQAFASEGLALRLPEENEQAILDNAVRRVKAGELHANPYLADINAMLARQAAAGTAAVLAGCTEIPLLFPYIDAPLEKFDATLLLARMVVARARGKE
ncbi:aspartate/glutamate racemase family protein [Anaeroselena agilis]|uniref:Amino acid racemase n=1 Tax=Anaeroselena agilis TaxID=3063788 RepID=A0ABU3P1S1_9FIRM|nr:amino acid racemase [Selenomonadales bacterium 4137-cl]